MMQLALDFSCHRDENNHDSRRHLEENRQRFSDQCQQVYSLLLSGVRLTVLSAITEYGISSLPRRILDLKESGIEIKDCWIEINNKRAYKEWYL